MTRHSNRPAGSYETLNASGTIPAAGTISHEVDTGALGYMAGHLEVSAAATLKIYYAMIAGSYGDPVDRDLSAGEKLDFDCGDPLAAEVVRVEIIAGGADVDYSLQCRGRA